MKKEKARADEEQIPVTAQIERVKAKICDEICKYPDQFKENEWDLLKYCEKCPLGLL